ncbi:discoidin domain-containing protein [Leptolyngbya sp. FACHB-541]|uniref:discoidin domain-containing protein n=1 Tax=Leptolyngbya sp. FACHB-541 TaxID=2692810 RepID=UPI001682C175|nr:discoidin domain-containing protein [Leptolyngbya sp. FACHB-541]MBD1995266.1 discoidin domain-containing protein [Leptolyngbya sp. FACHB-541]
MPIPCFARLRSRPVSQVWVASQSSVFGSVTPGTFANLNDMSGTTGTGTNSGSPEFIQATYTAPVTLSRVTVGGGNISGWGAVALYLNNAVFQYSTDNSNWITLLTFTGVTDSGATQFKEFTFAATTARYWRISRSSFLSTTEMRLS